MIIEWRKGVVGLRCDATKKGTFITEIAEIACDIRVAHLAKQAHILADLAMVYSAFLP